MDTMCPRGMKLWISRVTVSTLVLIFNLEAGTSLERFTMCNSQLQLHENHIEQGILELGIRHSDSSGNRVSCDFDIDAGPGKHIMFYFLHARLTPENQQHDVSCLELKDNVGTVQTAVEDFPMKVCFSAEIESPDHVFATVGNKLSIRFYRNRGYSMAAGFRLVFTSFRDGSCRTSERKCDNGRCIAHDIVCNDYNPCGDNSDCPTGLEHLSTLALAGIIITAILGGGTVIIIAAVCLQQGGRKRIGRQSNDWSTTYQSNGDVLEMQTEVESDVLSPHAGNTSSRYQLSPVSGDQPNDFSQPAPLYTEVERRGTKEIHVIDYPDDYFPDAGDPLTSSSPHESVTSATISSLPITMETQIPDSFNSQEQIGSEIFDSDIVSNETRHNNHSSLCSTSAILHIDYDNPAMISSSNDLSLDEDSVLLTDPVPCSKHVNVVLKSGGSSRQPPDYQIVVKNSNKFHVHDAKR